MLMARYDITYFMTLPLKIGYKLITTAYSETEKQKAWELWLSRQSSDSFQPFSKFLENSKDKPNVRHKKSAREMLQEASHIQDAMIAGRYKEVKM